MESMFDALILFIKDNPLLFLIIIAVTCFLFVLKQVIKWVIILVVLGGFILYGINYVPEGEDSLKTQILTQIEAKDYEPVERFLNNTKSATIKSTGNNGFVASSDGVKISGNLNGETVKVESRGITHTVKLTPELKSYLEKLY